MNTATSLRVIGLSRGLLLGLLGSTFTLAAHSGDLAISSDQASMNVSYAGLDLDDPAGMHTLYGRLKVAARIVCGGDISGVREVQRIFSHQACVEDALDAAVSSIDSPALTALHRESAAEAPVS
jgi:UrcA family protein